VSAAAGPGAWPVRRPTLHGGTVRLRPVRATFVQLENIGSRIVMQTHAGSSSTRPVGARVTSNRATVTVLVTV